VKGYIDSFEGYKLLSKKYKNAHIKLEIQCPKGHIFWKSYNRFQQGHMCPLCAIEKNKQSQYLTYQEVKQYIDSFEGYKLLSKKYKNAHIKLEIQCPKGHIYQVEYNSFQQGCRCPLCAIEKNKQSLSLTYECVKQYIESFEGYKLLSTDYKNNNTKLEIRCSKGHVIWMVYSSFQQGLRCSMCAGNKKLTNQEIIDKLSFCESIRETEDKQIEVKCTYCGDWYIPKRGELTTRIQYTEGRVSTESRFYCSQRCKQECPIYNQTLYEKGHKTASSREVQPELRQMALLRDDYTCQKCGKYKDKLDVGLHCHHIWPLNESPITSADIDECITYCVDCHTNVHKTVPGCGYGEMRCSV